MPRAVDVHDGAALGCSMFLVIHLRRARPRIADLSATARLRCSSLLGWPLVSSAHRRGKAGAWRHDLWERGVRLASARRSRLTAGRRRRRRRHRPPLLRARNPLCPRWSPTSARWESTTAWSCSSPITARACPSSSAAPPWTPATSCLSTPRTEMARWRAGGRVVMEPPRRPGGGGGLWARKAAVRRTEARKRPRSPGHDLLKCPCAPLTSNGVQALTNHGGWR